MFGVSIAGLDSVIARSFLAQCLYIFVNRQTVKCHLNQINKGKPQLLQTFYIQKTEYF